MRADANQSIVVVAHKFLPHPDDDLILYLRNQKRANVVHIVHGFPEAPDRRSTLRWYRAGDCLQERSSPDFMNWPEPLVYLKEMLWTLYWLFCSGRRWNVYIGMDGLCVLFGLMARACGRVERVVYWSVDFVPDERFRAAWKNKVYHRVNLWGCRRADEMWDLSARMAEARERYLGLSKGGYRSHRVVPYGVWRDRIKRYRYEECEQQTLVFVGHLLEKQGVQLVLQAIPAISACLPGFKFKIIGTGKYRAELERLAGESQVDKYVQFLGQIDQNEALEKEVAQSALAIAPYVQALDTWTYYADPGKVKLYLACGVPVLLTDVPWNARDIARTQCGEIISESPQRIAEQVVDCLGPEKNRAYRQNAVEYSKGFDYQAIFAALPI